MEINIIAEATKRGHEQVVFFNYPQYGLKALVAIHNTTLGPALGGCRMRIYEREADAIDDVLRLSEGMTYKSAMAGLSLGGGKSCLIADPQMKEGRTELFLKFAECLNHLGGRYITAEDMGTSPKDISIMRQVTEWAAGRPIDDGGSGDPSPWTAKGVFFGMLAAAERKYGSKDLKGKKVTVQGVGHVGAYLVEHLTSAGAKVYVSDTSDSSLDRMHRTYGAEVVEMNAIYDVDCDIYAPCAIGQTVNPDTIGRLKCSIIAGAANNQLTDPSIYSSIQKKGIMYCPDFVINAGGVISVFGEYRDGGWEEAWVRDKVEAIGGTIHWILDEADKRGKFSEPVAVELAKERISEAEKKKVKK